MNATICAAPAPLGVLVRIVDREAAADARRRSGEQRHDEVGELVPRQAAGFVGDVGQALRRELDGIEHVEVDVQPPPVHVAGQLLDRLASGACWIVGDFGERGQPHPGIGERADIELPPPLVVARTEHHKLFGPQRGQAIAEFAGQQSAGQPEQQPDLGVGRLAVLGHVQRHGVLVAVDEHQPDVADVVAQAGHDAEQRRAVAAVDEREPARTHHFPHLAVEGIGHGQQRSFVDQAGRRATGRIRIGQYQVVVVDHVVMVEGIAQPGVAQRRRRPGLVSGTPIAVERNPDQFDVGDCPAPHVRAISLSSR